MRCFLRRPPLGAGTGERTMDDLIIIEIAIAQWAAPLAVGVQLFHLFSRLFC